MVTSSLGERIKIIRKELGLTMEEFGKKFDPPADKSNVSRWEKNNATPSNERLKKIAELGNVSVKELLYGDIRHYLFPLVINISRDHYNCDISNNTDLVNVIINSLEEYSDDYSDTESSLFSNNKEKFDEKLLYPWSWNSEGIIKFASIRIFELKNELQEIIESESEYLDDSKEFQEKEKILLTYKKVLDIYSEAQRKIETLPIEK